MKNRVQYKAFGWWHVTTEGDDEGRTTRDLGYHYGYLDEIALRLAGRALWELKFKMINQPDVPQNDIVPAKKVHVSLAIGSGTWNMTPDQRAEHVKEILKGRPVTVTPGPYYAGFTITFNN